MVAILEGMLNILSSFIIMICGWMVDTGGSLFIGTILDLMARISEEMVTK
jgi:hypothetical protein